MKIKSFIFSVSLMVFLPLGNLYAKLIMHGIDSLFIESVEGFYRDAESFAEKVWPGMEMSPVCLFRLNGPALLYNHPDPPESFIKVSENLYLGTQNELQLFGATQVEINDKLTAIVDYGSGYYGDDEEVFAELFHEMHHVYQRNYIKQLEFDNPAVLLTYPEDQTNDGLKLYEQKLLYRMCFASGSAEFNTLLNQFYSCRMKRKELIGDYFQYEESVENMEGPAFYCEYRFYNRFSKASDILKENYNQKHFLGILTEPFYGRKNLRQRHLASGMAMCYILDKYFDSWKAEYYSGNLSLFRFFMSKFQPQIVNLQTDRIYFALSELHTQEEKLSHIKALSEFQSQPGIELNLVFKSFPEFRGFDPMHAESVNDSTVLHFSFFQLGNAKGDELSLSNHKSLSLSENMLWYVKKLSLFIPEEELSVENNCLKAEMEGVRLKWHGELISRDSHKLVFRCD